MQVPYLSYEVNKGQAKMSEFVGITQSNFEREAFWRAFERFSQWGRPRVGHARATAENDDASASVARDGVSSEGETTRLESMINDIPDTSFLPASELIRSQECREKSLSSATYCL